jgi:uncharacterized membrane protein YfcA
MGGFATVFSLVCLNLVVNTPFYQRDKFNLVVIGLLLFIAFKTLKGTKKQSNLEIHQIENLKIGGVGALAGILSALSGLGGGVIIISALNLKFNVDMKKAKSISLGVIFISSFVMSISNMFESPVLEVKGNNIGYIVWPLALILSAGVVIGSPLGVRFARKLSNRAISYIFVLFLVVVIIDKLLQFIA